MLPTNQSSNQSETNKSTDQPRPNKSTNRPETNKSIYQPINDNQSPTNQSINRLINLTPTNQPSKLSMNQLTDQPIDRPLS